MQVVINAHWGGFSLSNKAIYEYLKRKYGTVYAYSMKNWDGVRVAITPQLLESNDFCSSIFFTRHDLGNEFDEWEFKENNPNWYNDPEWKDVLFSTHDNGIEFRTDPVLIEVVKELGKEANGPCASLKIVKVPNDVEIEIEECDGWETVVEKHRSWG